MSRENMGKLWTTEEDDRIKFLLQNGVSLEHICNDVRRTPYGVVTRLQQLGVLVSIGRDFYRVYPEPWELATNVYHLQYPDGKPKKEKR